jgi:hypothetical protein
MRAAGAPAAEAAGWIQKSELGIRPVWHQRADRVEAHVLVCFLAYVLWKTLEQWQRRAGLGASPRTIFDELKRIQSTDVVLPTEDGRELRLRCVVRPDAAQATLLDLSRPVGERGIYFPRDRPEASLRIERAKGSPSPRGCGEFSGRSEGAARRRRRPGGPIRSRPAVEELFVVERCAVHVAGLPIRLAAEAQDGRVVDEAVGDGHGLRWRREKLSPALEGQIRHDDRGAHPIPGTDDPKEFVGGVAAEVRESRVVKSC